MERGMRSRVAVALVAFLLAISAAAGGAAAAAVADDKPAQAPAAEPEKPKVEDVLKRLETAFGKLDTVDTAFVQEKKLALFRKPVVLKGRIHLQLPDKLAWHVTEPLVYSLVLQGDVLRQWDEDTDDEQEISLAQNPTFRTVAGQLTIWFSGKYSELLKEYDVKIAATEPELRIDFTPQAKAMAAKAVKSVSVTFAKDEKYVKSIRFTDTTDDVTTLTFSDTKLNEALPKDAWNPRRNAKK